MFASAVELPFSAGNTSESRLLLLGFKGRAARRLRLPDQVWRAANLYHARGFLEDADWVVAIEGRMLTKLCEGGHAILGGRHGDREAIVLVRRRTPPRQGARFDGLVMSFACTSAVFRDLVTIAGNEAPERMCFALLNALMNGRMCPVRLTVHELGRNGLRKPIQAADELGQIAVIMAHRGKRRHLEAALTFLSALDGGCPMLRVGLDIDRPLAYRRMLKGESVEFFWAQPAPAGPYVIRQALADRSTEETLIFHDSDDISCHDRVATLTGEMRRTGCDLLGCHELRVDEVSKEVLAIRFPLNVSAALCNFSGHQFLHPSSAIRRDGFIRAGGFSTNQHIASDTQFILRAYFSLGIRNFDGFLYIRRKHPAALTVAKETALNIPLRARLARTWRADFDAVKTGNLALEQSSLRPIRSRRAYKLLRLSWKDEQKPGARA